MQNRHNVKGSIEVISIFRGLQCQKNCEAFSRTYAVPWQYLPKVFFILWIATCNYKTIVYHNLFQDVLQYHIQCSLLLQSSDIQCSLCIVSVCMCTTYVGFGSIFSWQINEQLLHVPVKNGLQMWLQLKKTPRDQLPWIHSNMLTTALQRKSMRCFQIVVQPNYLNKNTPNTTSWFLFYIICGQWCIFF